MAEKLPNIANRYTDNRKMCRRLNQVNVGFRSSLSCLRLAFRWRIPAIIHSDYPLAKSAMSTAVERAISGQTTGKISIP
jgi:hypothetical protein